MTMVGSRASAGAWSSATRKAGRYAFTEGIVMGCKGKGKKGKGKGNGPMPGKKW